MVILHRVKRSLHLKDGAAAIEQRSGPGKARVGLARKLSVILHSVWRSGEPFRWTPRSASKLVRSLADKRVAPGRGCRQLRGRGRGHVIKRKPVVDLAMPALPDRTRSCGSSC